MKLKQLTGRGRPGREVKAALGQKYRDQDSGKIWIMGPNGWELATTFAVDVLVARKSDWVKAANQQRMTLEEWATDTLDREASR